MGCTAQRFVGSLIMLVAISCGGDDPPEEAVGRPATFGDDCTLGGLDKCQDPFACIEIPGFTVQAPVESICTVACQKAEDCPSWESPTGVCKSQCQRLICRDVCN